VIIYNMDLDQEVPLTKSKGKNIPKVEPQEPIPEPLEAVKPPIHIPPLNIPIEKPVKIKKPRAPKTPAQLEAFKKAMEVRKKNIEQKKIDKKVEASKILLEHSQQIDKVKPKKQVVEVESEEEPEIVYVKRKSKKKKIIVESESDSEPEIEIRHRKDFGKSHQNKASIKTITKPESVKVSYHNFFTD